MSTSRIRGFIGLALLVFLGVASAAPVGSSSAPTRQTPTPTLRDAGAELTPLPTFTPVFSPATIESTVTLNPTATNTPVFSEVTPVSTVGK